MVIDLTQDSDPEDQVRSGVISLLPSKRGPETNSDSDDVILNHKRQPLQSTIRRPSSATSQQSNVTTVNGFVLTSARKLQHQTPSPSPALLPATAISVVVPSPSRQLKKEIESAEWAGESRSITSELTGLSEEFFPIDVHEKRGRKGAYPAARKINRAKIPLPIGMPGPILTKESQPRVHDQLCQSLMRKLAMIDGPRVSVDPTDVQRLARVTANFQFINKYTLRNGVVPTPADFIGGCGCNSHCSPETCLCFDQEEDFNVKIIPYCQARDGSGLQVLASEFLTRKAMIQECGVRCNCDDKCPNRVVQRGRTVRLQIFNTGRRGFGLRSPDYIRAGQFIDLYLGEVITKSKADRREEYALKNGHSYLFGLDWFPDINEEDIYVVDGQKLGGPTRFMNHSCKPNCRMIPVTSRIGDGKIYDLAFFSLKDIPPLTELTFDYNPNAHKSQNVDPSAVPCLCGEDNCRGQLWPNQRKGIK
ncbi:hypothetical protein BDV25DRAFT_140947 [Aspergillus avenaceus]|uniref:Uncharacterized protein n=1 Tax=Aspergillus avenaceus TaxID=36643 RepID=A0A5N6TSL4_ASPAV|nr:hypothetical protein BDV25DRAFT_140947 [Aspergillus avenaceus]